jgi:hypothetical protein
MHRHRTRLLPLDAAARHGVIALVVVLAGCTRVQQGGTQSTALMEATGTKISSGDLRALRNFLAISVPGRIETAADAIQAGATDPAMKRRAILWKVEVIPAFHQALFNADPLAAALEAWALSIQLEDLLSTGTASGHFGALQPISVEAARDVRLKIEAAARASAKTPQGFERAKASMERWAGKHPITGPLSSRPSIVPELAHLAEGGLDLSVFQAMANIPETVGDLATRMDIYAAYLPKSARWNMELMADDLANRDDAVRVLATLESVEKLTQRSNALLSPDGLRDALDDATARIRAERIAALASIDQQRVATLTYLTGERTAMMADLDRERAVLLQQLDELRKKSLSDVDELTARIIRRGAIALAVLLALAAALTFGVLRHAPRSWPRSAETP